MRHRKVYIMTHNTNLAHEWWNPLDKKLSTIKETDIQPCLCAWSDLLGFGNPLIESNWEPDIAAWRKIINRVTSAYHIHARHHSGFGEFQLMLNDGIVRIKQPNMYDKTIFDIAVWLREVVWSHIELAKLEIENNLPGARTVLTAGVRAAYSFEDIHYDDFVINYTRQNNGISKIAETVGNPLLAINPAPLQMNIAFSKAYILDDLGSKGGMKGRNLFVDQSVFSYLESLVHN